MPPPFLRKHSIHGGNVDVIISNYVIIIMSDNRELTLTRTNSIQGRITVSIDIASIFV